MKSTIFAQKITFILFLLGLLTASNQLSAQNSTLVYGDVIFLQNGWSQYMGGYLDTRGYQKDYEKTGNFLCVSTAEVKNRAEGSGSWRIMSATGKKEGSPVLINDDVYLFNQWNGNGGYLDTRGYQKDYEQTGNHLCVSTATDKNRSDRSGTWKLTISEKSHLDAGQTLKAGQRLMSANGAYILSLQEGDGNLCVYKYANGKQGSFVWGSMKSGFKNAKLTMQTDGNLVVYNDKNESQWASNTHPFNDAKYNDSNNKPVKLVLENDGVLKLYNAQNAVMWSSK
jgi:hypothetical protein